MAVYLLIAGDPERVPKIAKHWSRVKEVSSHREFRSFTGVYKGVAVSPLSSGVGPGAMSIVVNEAANIGAARAKPYKQYTQTASQTNSNLMQAKKTA